MEGSVPSTRLAQSYGYVQGDQLDRTTQQQLLSEPWKYWDAFYRSNKAAFFKDRHWLVREWPMLAQPGLKLCELGCGVGNSTLPLLEVNASLCLYCCDYSPTAVKLLEEALRDRGLREDPDGDGLRAIFVADVSAPEQVAARVPAGSCDAVLLIFVLSAMDASCWPGVVAAAAHALRTGGTVLLRDYGEEDATQHRFHRTPGSRALDGGGCVRGDGTQAHFFGAEQLRTLWEQTGSFVCLRCELREQEPEGRRTRRFVQAEFRRT